MSPLFSVSRTLAAPPDEVWRLLVEVENWPRWGPTVSHVRLDHSGGRIHEGQHGRGGAADRRAPAVPRHGLRGGPPLVLARGGGAGDLARVEAVGAGTRVTFGVPWWAPAYLAICELALRRLERLTLAGD